MIWAIIVAIVVAVVLYRLFSFKARVRSIVKTQLIDGDLEILKVNKDLLEDKNNPLMDLNLEVSQDNHQIHQDKLVDLRVLMDLKEDLNQVISLITHQDLSKDPQVIQVDHLTHQILMVRLAAVEDLSKSTMDKVNLQVKKDLTPNLMMDLNLMNLLNR
jgi:hypothetical protein